FIYSAFLNSNFNALDTKIINMHLKLGYLITYYPSWQAYGQSPDDQTPSTNDLKTENQQVPNFGVNKSNNINNIETQEVPVSNNLQDIKAGLNQFLALYKNQQVNASIDLAQSIHKDSYEKVILPLNPIKPDISLALETKFIELFDLVNVHRPYDEIVNKVKEIDAELNAYGLIVSNNTNSLTPTIAFASSFSIIFREGLEASIILGAIFTYLEASRNEKFKVGSSTNTSLTPTIAFASSFSIIFREGLEASIILGAIFTYLEASRNEKFNKYVYLGIVIAVATTLGIWFLLDYALQFSGINKDLLKGVAGMAAVAVLFWVSFWALNKMESKKWVEFIKSRVGKATLTGSVLMFISISFFTVFREGIETVIFYQSLFNFTSNIDAYIVSGLVLGIIVVITIAILIKKIMKKLPLRVIFGITMGIGAFMSVVFIGNAIRSFQEAGYIQITPVMDTIPMLNSSIASMTGIHPTLESLLGQIILVGIYLIGLIFMMAVKPKVEKINGSKVKSNG
ncbi:MAG: FTR1 family protein, partial [Candidatus Nitrosocosmicus sp.]|nr:FTR1 family protein [Candidatus Nitrosocosmicus sp.]